MKNVIALLALSLVINCTKTEKVEIIKEFDGPTFDKAVAVVHSLGDNNITGTIDFERTESGTRVEAKVSGLSVGNHGFHIHEFGDCSAPDGTSAGGHFNPDGLQHNSPSSEMRHMGDMGNLESNGEESISSLTYTDDNIYLEDIIGRGVIIHAGEDDLTSQPSGDAGSRIACGVIGIAQN